MRGLKGNIKEISGGDFSDWIYGTSKYTVPLGYEAYAFVPDSGGATIDAADWLRGNVITAISSAYKSKWLDQSVTAGFINFVNPLVTITLSAGSGMLYCRIGYQYRVTAGGGSVPANALLNEDGEALLNENGEYILLET